ncbi:hypothetical protein ACJX0J_024918, partial [Zea mays]
SSDVHVIFSELERKAYSSDVSKGILETIDYYRPVTKWDIKIKAKMVEDTWLDRQPLIVSVASVFASVPLQISFRRSLRVSMYSFLMNNAKLGVIGIDIWNDALA